jgi:hypothetical protein
VRSRHVPLAFVLACMPAACVVYEPVPAYYVSPSTFDRAWSASQGALEDVGVRVTSVDHATGIIRGEKDGIDVTVSVVRQADGRTRVQFDTKGSGDPGLASRLSQAYERRMGR